MTSGNTSRARNEFSVLARVRPIVELIDDAMQQPASHLSEEVEIIEGQLVALRDHLIQALRRAEQPPAALSSALAKINVALSLVVSIEYPGAGIHREALAEARDLLKDFPAA